MSAVDYEAAAARREEFFRETRKKLRDCVNPDGSGRISQFEPPWREILWILPALYTGSREDMELANRMAARFNTTAPLYQPEVKKVSTGKIFNVFFSLLSVLPGFRKRSR